MCFRKCHKCKHSLEEVEFRPSLTSLIRRVYSLSSFLLPALRVNYTIARLSPVRARSLFSKRFRVQARRRSKRRKRDTRLPELSFSLPLEVHRGKKERGGNSGQLMQYTIFGGLFSPSAPRLQRKRGGKARVELRGERRGAERLGHVGKR